MLNIFFLGGGAQCWYQFTAILSYLSINSFAINTKSVNNCLRDILSLNKNV